MSTSGSHRLMRRVAAFLIRGPDASFIVDDLDEAFDRDLAKGVSRSSAHLRYAKNLLGSALSTWRQHRRHPAGGLWLDAKLGARMLQKQPMLTLVAGFPR